MLAFFLLFSVSMFLFLSYSICQSESNEIVNIGV